MNSRWTHEVVAILAKEWRTEMRSRSASYTAFMLSAITVFTLAFAFYGRQLTSEAAAGMLWAALLFAGVGTLTRAFVAEEEQGTGDLLRMWARPHAVYWGKAIFALLQMGLTALVVSVLFLMLTGVAVSNYLLLALTILGGSAALAGMVTLVSAMISRGSNRSTLGGVVVMPLMVPLVALGVSGVRTAIEGSTMSSGWTSCLGVWEYTVAVLALAPFQFASIWGEA